MWFSGSQRRSSKGQPSRPQISEMPWRPGPRVGGWLGGSRAEDGAWGRHSRLVRARSGAAGRSRNEE
jgi:hypothetical protein